MGVFDSLPSGVGETISNVNFSGILSSIGKFVLVIIIFLFIGVITFIILWHKKNKKLYNKKIFWFEEVHGNMIPVDEDVAAELTIPGTNIQVFYIKKKDLYLPRPVKRMGKDSYWFCIKNNREIVNFSMKNMNEEMKEANLDYDHTDMRYALTNLKELIKRNYKDKSTPWWREYKDVISIVILIFIMSLSFFFLLSKIGTLIGQVGVLIEHADQVVKSVEAVKSSGVVQA